MTIKNIFASLLNITKDNITADEEKKLTDKLGLTKISEVKERDEVKIGGVVEAITYYPISPSSSLAVGLTLFDGSSYMDVIWLGRKQIIGINVGAHIIVEGTVVLKNERLAIMNPKYEILSENII